MRTDQSGEGRENWLLEGFCTEHVVSIKEKLSTQGGLLGWRGQKSLPLDMVSGSM